jgi:methyltransferase OMS1, mitochondrial
MPLPLVIVGTLFAGSIGYYATAIYKESRYAVPTNGEVKIDLNAVYNATANKFDKETGSAEFWSGITWRRKQLVKQADGDVLESAAGTGRNSQYYDSGKIKSLLLADRSEGMLDVCKQKCKQVMPGRLWRGKVGFVAGDLAEEGIDKKLGEGKFDTIVQTFAVCSTEEPEKLLRNLGTLVKEDGKILLLEHGKSHYNFVNRFLDNRAEPRAKKFGCWWNRDVGAIVEKSGLEIVHEKRYNFGTTWSFELKRPKSGQSTTNDAKAITSAPVAEQIAVASPSKSWWEFWR